MLHRDTKLTWSVNSRSIHSNHSVKRLYRLRYEYYIFHAKLVEILTRAILHVWVKVGSRCGMQCVYLFHPARFASLMAVLYGIVTHVSPHAQKEESTTSGNYLRVGLCQITIIPVKQSQAGIFSIEYTASIETASPISLLSCFSGAVREIF